MIKHDGKLFNYKEYELSLSLEKKLSPYLKKTVLTNANVNVNANAKIKSESLKKVNQTSLNDTKEESEIKKQQSPSPSQKKANSLIKSMEEIRDNNEKLKARLISRITSISMEREERIKRENLEKQRHKEKFLKEIKEKEILKSKPIELLAELKDFKETRNFQSPLIKNKKSKAK